MGLNVSDWGTGKKDMISWYLRGAIGFYWGIKY